MKKLKFNLPIITTSPTIATLFSIISKEEYSENWICNNFNNLLYIKSSTEDRCIFFEDQPCNRETIFSEINFLEYNKLNVNALKIISSDIIDFIERLIDNNYYLRIALDNYYIAANPRTYNKEHFLHPATIYGYDSKQKEFSIGEFFNRRKFQLYNLSYTELQNAFNLCIYPNDEEFEYLRNIILIKVIPSYTKEEININKIIAETESYLSSQDNTLKYHNRVRKKNSNYFYGIDCYKNLITSIQNNKIDTRSTHVIYDRMQLQSYKLDILFKNSFISMENYNILKEKITNLVSFSLNCRNATLKAQIKSTDPKLIMNYYNKLKCKEQEYLSTFLDSFSI